MTAATTLEFPQSSALRSTQLHSLSVNPRTISRAIPTVFVIEDDLQLRQSLELLIRSAGWQPETFASRNEFLARPRTAVPCCLVLDVNLPDFSGLELQERIAAELSELPLIFLTDHNDVRIAVQAMKSGAFEFFTRPFDGDVLLKAIGQAIKRSEVLLGREGELQNLRANLGSLTPREREVLKLVASGLPNKVVGGELGISEITVKMHRGNVMRKMNAGSFAHLVNMASRLRLDRVGWTSMVPAVRSTSIVAPLMEALALRQPPDQAY
jgi:FixJ family two-component response regulator